MRAQTAVLVASLAFHALLLSPLLGRGPPIGMDNSYHLGRIACLERNVAEGGTVFGWCSEHAGGYPLFRYYQHLPYVLTFAATRALPLGDADAFSLVLVLFFAAPALALFLLARPLGVPPGFAAAFLLLFPTCWGHDHCAYLNLGLWTQPFGLFFAILALWAQATARPLLAALLLALTMASHLILAYMLIPVMALAALLPPGAGGPARRLGRTALTLAAAALVSSYWLVPTLATLPFRGDNPWVQQSIQKRSLGAAAASLLASGRLFDGVTSASSEAYAADALSRPPLLTALGLLGLGLSLSRDRRGLFLALSFAVAFGLFMGEGTFPFLRRLPLEQSLYYIRALALVEVAFSLLAARGLGWLARGRRGALALAALTAWAAADPGGLWGRAIAPLPRPPAAALALLAAAAALAGLRSERGRRLAAAALVALVLLPLALERAASAGVHARSIRDYPDVARRVYGAADLLEGLPGPGRVLVDGRYGMGTHWDIGLLALRAGRDALSAYGAALDHSVLNHHKLGPELSLSPPDLALAGAGHVVSTRPLDGPWAGELVGQGVTIYEVANVSLFALVDRAPVFDGTWEEWREYVRSWDRRTVVVRPWGWAWGLPGPVLAPGESVPAMDQDITALGGCASSRYRHACRVIGPGYLVLKVAPAPEWHAVVDGAEVEGLVASPFYQAVALGPGAHDVAFEWRPSGLVLASCLASLASLGALAAAGHRHL